MSGHTSKQKNIVVYLGKKGTFQAFEWCVTLSNTHVLGGKIASVNMSVAYRTAYTHVETPY
jgi:hypothetical protein